jgi:PKD repeat protein
MKVARSVSTLPVLVVALGGVFLTACSSASSTGDTPVDAGSTMDVMTTPMVDSGSPVTDTGPSETVTANAASGSIYLGQIAQLDSSSSSAVPPSPIAYAWAIVSAPAGSVVATASIIGANSAKPSFTPDKAGDYSVKVTATAAGVSNAKTVTITVVAAPIFYVATDTTNAADPTSSFNVIRSDGTGGAAITCVYRDAGSPANAAQVAGSWGSDSWEAPPGTDSRATFLYSAKQPDGGTTSFLASATSSSSCAAPALVLDSAQTGNFAYQPRFSADGTRIAYVRNVTGEGARVATVGADGTTPHLEIATFFANDAGVNGGVTRPRWQDATHIGWVTATPQTGNATSWEISTAPDANGSAATLFMTCPTSMYGVATGFEFLPDGSVLVSALTPPGDGAPGPTDIVVLKPNGGTKACELVRNLSTLPGPSGAAAREFSLSPDKKRVAFLRQDTSAGAPASLFVAPVDGTTPPTAVSGAPASGGTAGPRWVAGGAMLSWGQSGLSLGSDAGVGVALVSAGGGSLTTLVAPTKVTSGYAFGNGFCSIGIAGGSTATGIGALVGFAALLVRRRRTTRATREVSRPS